MTTTATSAAAGRRRARSSATTAITVSGASTNHAPRSVTRSTSQSSGATRRCPAALNSLTSQLSNPPRNTRVLRRAKATGVPATTAMEIQYRRIICGLYTCGGGVRCAGGAFVSSPATWTVRCGAIVGWLMWPRTACRGRTFDRGVAITTEGRSVRARRIPVSVALALLLVSVTVAAGCGQQRAGTAPSPTPRPTPRPTPGLHDWAAVVCGSAHTLALQKNGSLWAWGGNDAG